LFAVQTHDSREHLAIMQRILGPVPHSMVRKTRSVCSQRILQVLHLLQESMQQQIVELVSTVSEVNEYGMQARNVYMFIAGSSTEFCIPFCFPRSI